MNNVKGKWALITGAARGIGYLSALYLAKQGCNLILHSRDLQHTEKILQEVKAMGVDAYAAAADLNDLNAVEKMLAQIDELPVEADIVLNNAGLQVAYRTDYFQTPSEDYEISFRVNTIAPALICYHFLPKMMAKGSGRIVNTTSGIALDVCQAGYSASKAALNKITIDLGSKLQGSDVMINLADPGWCRTDLGGDQVPNAPETALPGILVGVFADDQKSGRLFPAQDFAGMSLEEAVAKAESYESPY